MSNLKETFGFNDIKQAANWAELVAKEHGWTEITSDVWKKRNAEFLRCVAAGIEPPRYTDDGEEGNQ